MYRLFSFLWHKSALAVSVVIDGERHAVALPHPGQDAAPQRGQRFDHDPDAGGERVEVPLSALAVARSGDKGDRAHVAVIARDPKFAAVIGAQLTTQAVAAWFAHLAKGQVQRYDVPGVSAYNFVLDEALGGGGAASLRNDPLGKTFGQIILTHPVSIPAAWAADIEPGFAGVVAG